MECSTQYKKEKIREFENLFKFLGESEEISVRIDDEFFVLKSYGVVFIDKDKIEYTLNEMNDKVLDKLYKYLYLFEIKINYKLKQNKL